MASAHTAQYVAFLGPRQLARGSCVAVARAAKRALERGSTDTLLIFGARDSRPLDLDLHGSLDEVVARLSVEPPAPAAVVVRGPGRPKLGVVAREVTLLPRHWDWLQEQSGGASAALRRLVDEARKAPSPRQQRRAAQDAAYHFMQAIAGDLPGYEEATRALFADDRASLENRITAWPDDIRTYALRLGFGPGEPQNA